MRTSAADCVGRGGPGSGTAGVDTPTTAAALPSRATFLGAAHVDQAWAALVLSLGPWEWFATMTWPRRTGAERRMRDWCYWVSQLSQRREGLALGSRWHRSPARPRWVVAWEPHRSGSMHAHALLDSPTLRQVDRMHWLCQWHEYTGGMARLDTIDRADAVACYVSKYVTKDGELDFSPNVSERLPRVSAALLARGWRPSPWRALLFQRRAGATASPFVKRGQRATHEA